MWICKQSKEIVKAADDFSFYHLLQELKISDNYTGKHALYLGQSKKQYPFPMHDPSMYIVLVFF